MTVVPRLGGDDAIDKEAHLTGRFVHNRHNRGNDDTHREQRNYVVAVYALHSDAQNEVDLLE
jgi:hypothetical protein